MTYFKVRLMALTLLAFADLVGIAHAEANNRDVVHDNSGQIIHLRNGTCVRTKWDNNQDDCAPRHVAQQRMTRPVVEFTREERTVYFDFDRFDLSPEASTRLSALANALKADQTVKEALIVGYADRIGSISYNDRLSQKRAETVSNFLIAHGYTNAKITKTRWVGKSEPSTNCPSTETRSKLIKCLQADRRVEIDVGLQHNRIEPTAQ